MKKDELTEKYAQKIEPILPLAKRAYGLRGQATPEHKASEKYTALLKEYYSKGGSLVALAEKLGVAYSGMRRRIFASSTPPAPRKPRSQSHKGSKGQRDFNRALPRGTIQSLPQRRLPCGDSKGFIP